MLIRRLMAIGRLRHLVSLISLLSFISLRISLISLLISLICRLVSLLISLICRLVSLLWLLIFTRVLPLFQGTIILITLLIRLRGKMLRRWMLLWNARAACSLEFRSGHQEAGENEASANELEQERSNRQINPVVCFEIRVLRAVSVAVTINSETFTKHCGDSTTSNHRLFVKSGGPTTLHPPKFSRPRKASLKEIAY